MTWNGARAQSLTDATRTALPISRRRQPKPEHTPRPPLRRPRDVAGAVRVVDEEDELRAARHRLQAAARACPAERAADAAEVERVAGGVVRSDGWEIGATVSRGGRRRACAASGRAGRDAGAVGFL